MNEKLTQANEQSANDLPIVLRYCIRFQCIILIKIIII